MSLQTNYRCGSLTKVTMHNPTAVSVHAFLERGKSEPFVSVHISDGDMEVVLFLTHALALELGVLLYKLPLEATPDP